MGAIMQKVQANHSQPPAALKKTLRLFDLFTIGFGAIVGVGWVVVVGDWINMGGGPLPTALAFLTGAVFLFPIARSFGELSSAIPVAGGCVVYTQKAFGKNAAFFSGWFLTLAYVMMCPWEVIAIGQLAETLLPFLKTAPLYVIGGYTIYLPSLLLCCGIAIAVFYLNHIGVNKVSKLQNTLVLILLAISCLTIVIALSLGNIRNLYPIVSKTPSNPSGSFVSGFVTTLCLTPFFYSGFDTIGQEAEEVEDNMNYGRMGKVPSLAVCASAVFYALVIISVSMLLPWGELLSLQLPAAEAFALRGIGIMRVLVIIGAFAGLLTTLNSFFIAGSRVLLSMGRLNILPEFLSRLHPKYKTPTVANGLIITLCLIAPFLGKSVLLPITNVCSLGFILSWLMVALSDVKIKKDFPDMTLPYKVPLYSNILAICLSAAMFLLLVLPASPGALAWPLEIGIVLAWLLLGITILIIRKKRGR